MCSSRSRSAGLTPARRRRGGALEGAPRGRRRPWSTSGGAAWRSADHVHAARQEILEGDLKPTEVEKAPRGLERHQKVEIALRCRCTASHRADDPRITGAEAGRDGGGRGFEPPILDSLEAARRRSSCLIWRRGPSPAEALPASAAEVAEWPGQEYRCDQSMSRSSLGGPWSQKTAATCMTRTDGLVWLLMRPSAGEPFSFEPRHDVRTPHG
jgi:hypothetical protein